MKDWDGAYETCFQQNSHLVVVRDEATNADLYKAVEPLKSKITTITLKFNSII